MEKYNKIKKVYPIDNYILICEFESGIKKKYDIKPLIKKYAIFKKLITNKELFSKVVVDTGGYGISWDDEIDLAAEEIWENGKDFNSIEVHYSDKQK